jgi:ABC-type Fe3+-hydroxamate transport system substrate-binding protein
MPPRRSWPALGLVVAVLAGACGRSAAPVGDPPARRLVVMAPAGAEIVAALGAVEEVVAVGDFVAWPPVLAARPRVGAYDAPSLERILALGGNVYVTARSQAGQRALARLADLGVEIVELDTATYAGTLESIAMLGAKLGREPQAAALAAEIGERVAAVRARAASAPARRVLVVVGREPLYVAGPGSHLDELVRAAGGENVAADALAPYQLLSLEAALARRPEVILDSSENRPGALRGRALGDWRRWPFLPAVAERRVYFVDPVRLSIPGPRLGEMAELLAKLIHPELFGEASPEELGPLASPEPSPPRGGEG